MVGRTGDASIMTTAVPPSGLGTGTPGNDSGIAQATAHLWNALAIVDRLLTDSGSGPLAGTTYHLGEASRSIHHALLALTECDPG